MRRVYPTRGSAQIQGITHPTLTPANHARICRVKAALLRHPHSRHKFRIVFAEASFRGLRDALWLLHSERTHYQVCPMDVSSKVHAQVAGRPDREGLRVRPFPKELLQPSIRRPPVVPAGAASGNHLAVRRRRCFVAVQTFPADTSAVCRNAEPGAPGPSHLVVRRRNQQQQALLRRG
jgi:hypothetical protein